jgi:putative membrane protein
VATQQGNVATLGCSRPGAAPDSADLRDALAVDRTLLAAERTYAAWLRTGLAALASGAGAHSVLKGVLSERLEQSAATVLILFAVFCFGAGVWRQVRAQSSWPRADVPRMAPHVLCLASGTLALVSVAVITGIWLRP